MATHRLTVIVVLVDLWHEKHRVMLSVCEWQLNKIVVWLVRQPEDDLGIPKSTVWRIFSENLGLTHVCAKFIPKLLSEQQKNLRLEIAQNNLEIIKSDENLLKKVIIGDESWFYSYNPKTKQQSSQWILLGQTSYLYQWYHSVINNINHRSWSK